MKIHNYEESWNNFYKQILNDKKTHIDIKDIDENNKTLIRIYCSNKFNGMFEELFPASKDCRVVLNLTFSPSMSCNRYIFEDSVTIAGGKILGTPEMYLNIMCNYKKEKYRDPIDIVKNELRVIDGMLLPLQKYWENESIFNEANISFDVVSDNMLKVYFPKDWKKCKHIIELDNQHYMCSYRGQPTWCEKENCNNY